MSVFGLQLFSSFFVVSFVLLFVLQPWFQSCVATAAADSSTQPRHPSSSSLYEKPHILMIVMDDLGSHDLGIHGSGIHTPHSNRLATTNHKNNGGCIYLDQYYVLPYCSPTRAALLSGKYPLHTGVHNVILAQSTAGLPLGEETLADLLQRAGYRTNAIGKWHVGHSSWQQTPTFRGFDEFYGYYLGAQDYFSHDHLGAYDLRHDQRPFCGKGCSKVVDEREQYSSPLFAREAIRMMKEYTMNRTNKQEQRDNPLFQYLAFQAVHCPNEVPQKYIDLYHNRTEWTEQRKIYAGMLTAADEAIGQVVHAYEQAGLWDNTLLIFTTDNGGPTTWGCVTGASNYPKRGGKFTLWEGGITGDGFLSGPALSKLITIGQEDQQPSFQPRRFPHLFHVVDWLPTLAEWVGVVPLHHDKLDGVSQVQALQTGVAARTEVFLGYAGADENSQQQWFGPSLRHGNWKVVQGEYAGPDERRPHARGTSLPMPGGLRNSTYLLYDLDRDPLETTNLATQYPVVLQTLIYKLQLYQQSYVAPLINNASDCPFTGFVNDSRVGPVWEPWCGDHPQEAATTML
ncbi:hypothetical protein ACA910_007326 [Epithemia clementina (nom. ined.)]